MANTGIILEFNTQIVYQKFSGNNYSNELDYLLQNSNRWYKVNNSHIITHVPLLIGESQNITLDIMKLRHILYLMVMVG